MNHTEKSLKKVLTKELKLRLKGLPRRKKKKAMRGFLRQTDGFSKNQILLTLQAFGRQHRKSQKLPITCFFKS